MVAMLQIPTVWISLAAWQCSAGVYTSCMKPARSCRTLLLLLLFCCACASVYLYKLPAGAFTSKLICGPLLAMCVLQVLQESELRLMTIAYLVNGTRESALLRVARLAKQFAEVLHLLLRGLFKVP